MTESRIRATARPTNADLMGAMNELHNCLHEHVKETREGFTTMGEAVHKIDVRVARMEGASDATNRVLGVHVEGEDPSKVKVKKPFFLLTVPKALWYVTGAAAAGAGGYKLLWAMALAAHAYLLTVTS